MSQYNKNRSSYKGNSGQHLPRYRPPRNPEKLNMLQEQYNTKYDYGGKLYLAMLVFVVTV